VRESRDVKDLALVWLMAVAAAIAVPADTSAQEPADQSGSAPNAPEQPAEDDTERTTLNLLGEVDSEEGEGRRNENVRITLIDNNVLRELTTRMGTTATLPIDLRIEHRYFASEFGQPPRRIKEASLAPSADVHGQLNWTHQNSVTSARSFFQAGGVRPAHDNTFGFTLGMPAWRGSSLMFDGYQVTADSLLDGVTSGSRS